MVFSSLLFLFRFLPAVLLCYYLVPRRARNFVLFLFSLIFYAWGEPVYIILHLLRSFLILHIPPHLMFPLRTGNKGMDCTMRQPARLRKAGKSRHKAALWPPGSRRHFPQSAR